MKYKVGDKVKVRKDLVENKSYGINTFVDTMAKFKGKVVTISEITSETEGEYHIEEDGESYFWTAEMLEPVEDITIIIRDNKVIAKKGNKVGIAKCAPEDEFNIFTGAKLALDRLEEKCYPYSWLKYGDGYYVPSLIDEDFPVSYTYRADPTDIKLKERGLVFKTKEEAINCAKKMLKIVK